MPHTPTQKNIKKSRPLGKLIAVGLLFQVLMPSLALAFTPMSQGNQACIQGSNQCAPTMAACNAERATITGTPPPCVDYSVPGPGSLVSQAFSKGLDFIGGGILDLLGSGLALIAKLIFELAGKFLDAMGYVLDFSIGRTIDSATYNDLQAVNKGWTAVRDFSNLFFIFALLYIAIKTILGMGGGSTKRWVAHLIIAALLINFSLFATKVVIDAGNVLAMGFWEKITVQQGPNQVSSATANFQQGFRIQTNFDAPGVSPWQRMTIYLGGAFVMMIAGYVFMVGAMMMIVRTITLLFLMIASPFAFLGFALPVGGSWAGSWLTKLLGSTFVAPAFLAMLYIDSIIINSLDLTKLTGNGATSGFAAAFLGRSDNYGIFYQFFLMIFLLLAALKVADAVSSGASSAAKGYLNKAKAYSQRTAGATYRTAAATVGAVGRQTVGRRNKTELVRLQNDKSFQETLKKDDAEGRAARMKLAKIQERAASTYDVRNTRVGGAVGSAAKMAGVDTGTGSKHNRIDDDAKDKKDKKVVEDAKKLFPGNEEAQARYIKEHMSKSGLPESEVKTAAEKMFPGDKAKQEAFIKERMASRLDLAANKATKEKIASDLQTAQNKADFEKAFGEGKERFEKLEKLEKDREDMLARGVKAEDASMVALTKTIDEITKDVKPLTDVLKSSTQRMTGEQVAKLMNKAEYRNSATVRRNFTGKDMLAINKMAFDGKYTESMSSDDQARMMDTITREALRSTDTAKRNVVRNAQKSGAWVHNINFREELEDHIKNKSTDESFNETWRLLDNEDKAELKDLLLDERVASRLTGSTMGVIGKKGNEGLYGDVAGFDDKMKEYHASGVLGKNAMRNGRNTASDHINNNSKKVESYFHKWEKGGDASSKKEASPEPATTADILDSSILNQKTGDQA